MSIFAARLSLAALLCTSVVTATAGTVRNGDTTISFENFAHPVGEHVDSLPKPVGGWQAFASKLYYPRYLRVRGSVVHGSTKVFVTIDADGHVADISFSPNIHPRFRSAVITAIHRCRWKPATRNNVPVRNTFWMPINFSTYHVNTSQR
jgi:TonB family protein